MWKNEKKDEKAKAERKEKEKKSNGICCFGWRMEKLNWEVSEVHKQLDQANSNAHAHKTHNINI